MAINKPYMAFLGVLLAIDIAFLSQLLVDEADFQPMDAIHYGRIVVGIMTVVVLLLVAQELLRARKAALAGLKETMPGHAAELDEEQKRTKKLNNLLLLATFCAFFFYCMLFNIIGYYTTGFIVLIGYMSVLFYAQNGRLKGPDILKIVVIAVGTTAVLYLIFSVFFTLWLPRGILF
ncbi:membrane hypothetical protein [uncultured delta proteobacterium]|uniref:DUF1468 domain-containing protein n=1 Tax=uncultured delta proteobacterium TaxID=34034 RepID=A0A212JK99_9DELT|nr:membrane hypothetical protein [uncultured delta proteobacterium]